MWVLSAFCSSDVFLGSGFPSFYRDRVARFLAEKLNLFFSHKLELGDFLDLRSEENEMLALTKEEGRSSH